MGDADHVIACFKSIDADGSGFVTRDALARIFETLGPEWDTTSVETLITAAGVSVGDSVPYKQFIHWLATCPRCPGTPIKKRSKEERSRFLNDKWHPFYAELTQLLAETRRRRSAGFSAHEVMPSHTTIATLVGRCLSLTLQWHGRGNVSAMYEVFMDMAELDGHSPYAFRDIPQKRSSDGYIRVLDGQARRKFYSAKPSGPASNAPEKFVGRVPQNTGESPIDNLVLPNIMRRRAALLLFVGHRVQAFFVRTLRWKQRRILSALGLPAESEDESVCADVKRRVALAVEERGVQGSAAHDALIDLGHLIQSYGQLRSEVRGQLESFLEAEIGARSGAQPEVEPDVLEFMAHCEKHPGRAYTGSRVHHKLMLLKAVASPAVRIVCRSQLEAFTQHKYFVTRWRRRVPLLSLPAPAEDGSAVSTQLITVRPVDAIEVSRFRKNVFAYGEAHGLGQSGGGCAEQPCWGPGTFMYEWGTLLCEDEEAKVPNVWLTDIEKIVQDCLALCPDGGTTDSLPGESLHDVGQNPFIASSIRTTQHTQAMRASALDFPLVAEKSDPKWCERIAAWVDIVQVGDHEDAFFVTARTRAPDAEPFLSFFVELRVLYLRTFGRTVDLNVSCHPHENGEYTTIFAPLTCMKKIDVPKGEGCRGQDFDFQNPDTGERVTQKRLPIAMVDCSHGKGNVLAIDDNYWNIALDGRPVLQRLYDLNRKPGSRDFAERYVRDFFA